MCTGVTGVVDVAKYPHRARRLKVEQAGVFVEVVAAPSHVPPDRWPDHAITHSLVHPFIRSSFIRSSVHRSPTRRYPRMTLPLHAAASSLCATARRVSRLDLGRLQPSIPTKRDAATAVTTSHAPQDHRHRHRHLQHHPSIACRASPRDDSNQNNNEKRHEESSETIEYVRAEISEVRTAEGQGNVIYLRLKDGSQSILPVYVVLSSQVDRGALDPTRSLALRCSFAR